MLGLSGSFELCLLCSNILPEVTWSKVRIESLSNTQHFCTTLSCDTLLIDLRYTLLQKKLAQVLD